MPSRADYQLKREDIWRKTLSTGDIHHILTSDKTEEQMATLYRVTTQTIRHIRRYYPSQMGHCDEH